MSVHRLHWHVNNGAHYRGWVWEVVDDTGRVLSCSGIPAWTRFGAWTQSARAARRLGRTR